MGGGCQLGVRIGPCAELSVLIRAGGAIGQRTDGLQLGEPGQDGLGIAGTAGLDDVHLCPGLGQPLRRGLRDGVVAAAQHDGQVAQGMGLGRQGVQAAGQPGSSVMDDEDTVDGADPGDGCRAGARRGGSGHRASGAGTGRVGAAGGA